MPGPPSKPARGNRAGGYGTGQKWLASRPDREDCDPGRAAPVGRGATIVTAAAPVGRGAIVTAPVIVLDANSWAAPRKKTVSQNLHACVEQRKQFKSLTWPLKGLQMQPLKRLQKAFIIHF